MKSFASDQPTSEAKQEPMQSTVHGPLFPGDSPLPSPSRVDKS